MQRPSRLTRRNPHYRSASHAYYAMYLSKLLGPFATVGMAEDTWALNESVLDEDTFLAQVESIKQERERMFFSALDRTRRGLVACVFDTTDRVQHMFYRYLDERAQGPHAAVIERLYCDMDRLVGETLKYVDEKTAVFVLSDHGFCSFRRGVNLNTWLQAERLSCASRRRIRKRKVLRRRGLEPHSSVRNGTGRTLPQPDRPRIGRNGIRVRRSRSETGTRV